MSAAVEVRLEWQEIPTYGIPPDSPYPSFGLWGWRSVYPYSMKTDLSSGPPTPVRHRVAVLENRYVRVSVLPDMGGRVYGLFDKTAGKETIMVPPSIKFANVASRGAWIGGGIEFNFGRRGHTVLTVSPVSWALRREPDGAASIWVGSVVHPVGSRWALRIGLRPDRAAMDMDIHTMGPQVLPGLMYWWTNAGVEVTRQSRFFYFGLHADANLGRHGWPVTDGLDFRWYRNRFLEADMFLMDAQTDYLGFYDYGRHHGLAQTADRFLAPGQKYFTWGTHPQGRYWDAMFSDTGQTYCEIQRGRLPTQGLTEPLGAMACESWQETWIPIRDTEGFSATESDLVLSVVPEGDRAAHIHLLAVEPKSNLHLEARSGEQSLGTWQIQRLKPEEVFTQPLQLPPGRACDRVKVTDAAGKVLMDWQEFKFKEEDWFSESAHHHGLDDSDTQSVDQMFTQAERYRLSSWRGSSSYCKKLHEKILARDPGHPGVLRAMGEQCMQAGQYDQAVEHFRKALERSPRDPAVLTPLGWALLRLGRQTEAVEALATAARQESSRRSALVGLACVHLRAGRADLALAAADRLLAEFPADKWGRITRVTALRRAGQVQEAKQSLEALLAEDPIWVRPHAEALLLGVEVDLAGGSRKLADDSVTAASPYIELELWDDAAAILALDESNEPFSPAIRLAHLAYVQHRSGDTQAAAATVARLAEAPVELAHPWAELSIDVLRALAASYGDTAAVHCMLGNVLASRELADEAAQAWGRAIELGMEHPVPLRNLAMLLDHRGEHEKALELYRRAWKVSGKNRYLFSEIDGFLGSRGLHAERLKLYQELPEESQARSMVAMRRVLQLLDNSMYDEALQELSTRTFLRGEYERMIRYNYVEAVVGAACPHIGSGNYDRAREVLLKGLEYPRNLNMGRHGTMPNESTIHYLLGVVAEMAGQADAARRHYLAAATEMHLEGTPYHAYEMLAWLSLGDRARGMSLAHKIEQLARGEAEGPAWFRWYYEESILKFTHGLAQLAKGRIEEARRMWQAILDNEPDARWVRLHLNMPPCLLERMGKAPAFPEQ